MQAYATVLRSFFRYAEHQGWCAPGLAATIRSPRLFADASLPKGPSWEDVQQLLTTTEGDQPKDIRDQAIILLFAVYGMRVGEVRGGCKSPHKHLRVKQLSEGWRLDELV